MSYVAPGFDGQMNSPCPVCGVTDEQFPRRITVNPMKMICTGCGELLVELTAEEEEALQRDFTDRGEPRVGEMVCDGHEEN